MAGMRPLGFILRYQSSFCSPSASLILCTVYCRRRVGAGLEGSSRAAADGCDAPGWAPHRQQRKRQRRREAAQPAYPDGWRTGAGPTAHLHPQLL